MMKMFAGSLEAFMGDYDMFCNPRLARMPCATNVWRYGSADNRLTDATPSQIRMHHTPYT